jgi:hypothetical protein
VSEITRQQKITFGEMRASGVHGLLIYCSDYKCGHSIAINPNEARGLLARGGVTQITVTARDLHQTGYD